MELLTNWLLSDALVMLLRGFQLSCRLSPPFFWLIGGRFFRSGATKLGGENIKTPLLTPPK
jgi:hypothetical protein